MSQMTHSRRLDLRPLQAQYLGKRAGFEDLPPGFDFLASLSPPWSRPADLGIERSPHNEPMRSPSANLGSLASSSQRLGCLPLRLGIASSQLDPDLSEIWTQKVKTKALTVHASKWCHIFPVAFSNA